MLKILNHISLIRGNNSLGLEVFFNSREEYDLVGVELSKSKDNVEVSRTWESFILAEVDKTVKQKLPVYVSLSGRGLVHKKLNVFDNTSDQELLHQLLPNASIKEFYVQKVFINENNYWVSVIRRDQLDPFLEELERHRLFVVDIQLGPFSMSRVLQLFDTNRFYTKEFQLDCDSESVIDIQKNSEVQVERYEVGNENITSDAVVAFAHAFTHFLPQVESTQLKLESVKNMKEEYLNKNKFTVVGFAAIVLFFIVTIGNMLINNRLQEHNNELQFKMNGNEQFVQEIASLKEELKVKEQFVQGSGLTQASRISFYADQIAETVPVSIQLDHIWINPLLKKVTKAEDLNFGFKDIKIIGQVNESIELNNWMNELRDKDWVSEVEVIGFNQDNYKTKGEFEIRLRIKG